jgi:DNA-binding SARP family transcriptional activator/Tfp pilus assembly protein PilF
MEYRLLGPLEVTSECGSLLVRSARQQIVLAMLLLEANYVVSMHRLAQAMWGGDGPATARSQIQTCISALRRELAAIGAGDVISTRSGGYSLGVAAADLDLTRFRRLASDGFAAGTQGRSEAAVRDLRAALALWRGPVAAGLESQLIQGIALALEEERLAALECCIELELSLGRHHELIAELSTLVRQYPFRERLRVHHMLALYRSARQADALESFAQARRLFRDELGLEPGPELAALQRSILAMDAGLVAGRDSELAGELQPLAAEHPQRERFHAQLMLAPYRSGRRADALAAYRQAHRVLVEELAAEPGTELRELHQQVLAADPALKLPEPASAVAVPHAAVPRQLPAAVEQFTGRDDELAELTAQLRPAGRAPRTVVISAIGGTAGVGKTALAVHWAHQASEHFPDGQLYVNLRGYDPGQPVPPGDALAGFLRALGVPGQDLPAEVDERAARFRSLLAGRQILVLLDNAGSVEQVRPLLPGTPGCAVLVTSRDALAGLVARDGARRLDLDLLPLADAVSLLRALIGGRVDADPKAAATLTAQCCRLPLALRVAAEHAAARPAVPLAGLTGELADQQQRLDLLDAGGDPATAIRAVFSWSYRHLEPDTARAFRLAGLHPGPDLDPFAAAALTGSSLPRVGRLLDQLALAHLINPTGPGRSGMHDLLRAYARELAAAEEEQRAALTRLFDYYLHTAAAAMDALFPAEQQHRPRIPASEVPAPLITGTAAALAWLDAERENLVSVAMHSAEHHWPGHATRLASTLFRYLETGGHHREAVTIHSYARRAARDTGDRAAEAIALTNLGLVDLRQGCYRQATGYLRKALALYREADDRSGEARTLHDIGIADFEQGRYPQAAGHFQKALMLYRGLGDRVSEARALNSVGLVDTRLGRYQQAADNLRRAMALCRDVGNSAVAAYAALNLSDVDLRQGRCRKATSHLQQVLALFREIGDRTGEAYALTGLGDAVPRPEQPSAGYHEEALALFRETGNRSGEAEALNGLGKVFLLTGQDDQARAQHAAALVLASQIGNKYQQARSHEGLARAYGACGNPGYARRHWQKALILYTDLGVPEALQVHTQLAAAVNKTERAIPGP